MKFHLLSLYGYTITLSETELRIKRQSSIFQTYTFSLKEKKTGFPSKLFSASYCDLELCVEFCQIGRMGMPIFSLHYLSKDSKSSFIEQKRQRTFNYFSTSEPTNLFFKIISVTNFDNIDLVWKYYHS